MCCLKMDVVFSFVRTNRDIAWFKIAPFNPGGRDDALFAFMESYDLEQLRRRAWLVCNFWTQPHIDSLLSSDVPAFQ